jgi:F-type H+-transporting ATPase subunit epsilon
VSLDLEILVPDGVVLRTRVRSLQAEDASGRFALLPGHQAFLTVLIPGVLVYRDEEGREHYAAVDGGVLLLEQGRVSVATSDAVVADRLEEVADAAAAMLTARRAQERTARAAFAELETTLLRELGNVERRR